MPDGRVTIGRVPAGLAAVGRPTPAPGERTTGACGARAEPPALAPPARPPAAPPRWANTRAGISSSAEAKKIPQIVLRPTAGKNAVGFNGHPPDPDK